MDAFLTKITNLESQYQQNFDHLTWVNDTLKDHEEKLSGIHTATHSQPNVSEQTLHRLDKLTEDLVGRLVKVEEEQREQGDIVQ